MESDVTRLLPHRPPFLFVDEIVSASDESLTTRFHVRPELDFFKGHYPGNPIMPGVLISEAVFQTAAVFVARHVKAEEDDFAGSVPVLARIQNARFRSIVRPGDMLTIEVRLKERSGRFFFMSGLVRADRRKVMTVDFRVALSDAETARPPSASS